jgi:hypothetical protein
MADVRIERDLRIPMRDGIHLAANLYLPEAPRCHAPSRSPQDRDRIVANGEERHVLPGESGEHALQLHELRLAERLPLRAAVEDDEGRAAAAGVV